jgi:hypothetical protein
MRKHSTQVILEHSETRTRKRHIDEGIRGLRKDDDTITWSASGLAEEETEVILAMQPDRSAIYVED